MLRAGESAPPVAGAEVLDDLLAQGIGATEVSFLIADLSGRSVVRLSHNGRGSEDRREGPASAERVSLHGSPHGRALESQRIQVESSPDGARVFAPVTNRGDAIGVLELTLPAPPDDHASQAITNAARALGYVVIANRRFTDLYEWGRRTVPLSLAAEIQHRLLPGSFSCEAGQFTLSAWLEPSGKVAGDTFDFAIERDALHLSITDAMGHAVGASLLATVLVGALRNARRGGMSLADQARRANNDLVEHATSGEFVTGQVVRVNLRTETATVVNAGHVLPLRVRDRDVEALALNADLPFGTFAGATYSEQTLPLRPGDRVIFLTDGMVERNAADVDLAAYILAATDLHPREVVQHMAQVVLEATDGRLKDDATIMCLDWHGGPPRNRREAS